MNRQVFSCRHTSRGIHSFRYLFLAKLLSMLIAALMLQPAILNAQGKSTMEKAGDATQILIPSIAFATTFVLDDKEGRNEFYKSFLTNAGVTYGLKIAINKSRPENNGDYSFPSGHTSASFQGAAFIHRRYGWKYAIPAYAAAAFVGLSRIEGESDKHDIADVMGGAAIGIISSFYFTKPYKGVVITPTVGDNAYALTLTKRW